MVDYSYIPSRWQEAYLDWIRSTQMEMSVLSSKEERNRVPLGLVWSSYVKSMSRGHWICVHYTNYVILDMNIFSMNCGSGLIAAITIGGINTSRHRWATYSAKREMQTQRRIWCVFKPRLMSLWPTVLDSMEEPTLTTASQSSGEWENMHLDWYVKRAMRQISGCVRYQKECQRWVKTDGDRTYLTRAESGIKISITSGGGRFIY